MNCSLMLTSILGRIMETSGGLGDIIKYMTQVVNWLREYLPIDDGANWLKANVPLFADIDQPSLVLAVGMLALWVIVAGTSNIIRNNTALFVIVLVIIAVAGYMGMV